ncbi:MAG: metallophosphoesterase [Anaerolineales bacterium]|nr:metallophosphoesterase [Anaerolineales bacterium]
MNQSLRYILFSCLFVSLLFVSNRMTLQAAEKSSTVVYLAMITRPPSRVAALGDFGEEGAGAQKVAALINSWQPDIIITMGDNNYPDGEMETFDRNVGQYYGSYIYPYVGEQRWAGRETKNRFFPSIGNHDWRTEAAQPYFDYFPIFDSHVNTRSSSHERYYDFVWEGVHFFVLNSVKAEPDGVDVDSVQAQWLQEQLASSTAAWQIVYFHHPPYSSGGHGSSEYMQWPFAEWGVDAVLSGHDHHYERLEVDGIPYFVNGVGGHSVRPIRSPLPESRKQFDTDLGAMLLVIWSDHIVFEFYAVRNGGDLVDQYVITHKPISKLPPRP